MIKGEYSKTLVGVVVLVSLILGGCQTSVSQRNEVAQGSAESPNSEGERSGQEIRQELDSIIGRDMSVRLLRAVNALSEEEIERAFSYIQNEYGDAPYPKTADTLVVLRHEDIVAERALQAEELEAANPPRGRQVYETVAARDWSHAQSAMASLSDEDKEALFEYLVNTDSNELPFLPPRGRIYGYAEVLYRGIEYPKVLQHYLAVMEELRYEREDVEYVKSLRQDERDRLIQFAAELKTLLDPEEYIRSIVSQAERELNEEQARAEREAEALAEEEAEARQREIDLARQPKFRDTDWSDSEQTILVRENRRGIEFSSPSRFDYGGGYEVLSYVSEQTVALGNENARVMYNFLRGRLFEGRLVVELPEASVDEALQRYDTLQKGMVANFGPPDREEEFRILWRDRFVDRVLIFHWLPERKAIELRYAWRALYSAISQLHLAATGEVY